MRGLTFKLALGTAALGLAGCGADESDKQTLTTTGRPVITVRITTDEHFLSPQYTRLSIPGTYDLQIENEGDLAHALRIEHDGRSADVARLEPGATAALTLDLSDPGVYDVYCPLDGDRGKGMVGTIIVGQ